MLHISFALKQDQELGTELVKIIKSNKAKQLELFNVACLLTAARIHRLQDTIFDLFKASVVSIYKDSDRLDKCYWISEFSPLDAEEYGQVFLDVVETSATAGWDQVIQSLTQLALILIDTAANANAFFAAAANTSMLGYLRIPLERARYSAHVFFCLYIRWHQNEKQWYQRGWAYGKSSKTGCGHSFEALQVP